MPFPKGHNYGNRKGRPKGSKNKSSFDKVEWDEQTVQLFKDKIIELAKEKNQQILLAAFKAMVAPKIQKSDINEEISEYEEYTDEQLKNALEEYYEKYKQ